MWMADEGRILECEGACRRLGRLWRRRSLGSSWGRALSSTLCGRVLYGYGWVGVHGMQ